MEESVESINHILKDISETLFEGMEGTSITFSCGIVEYKKEWDSNEFFNQADQAMYQAKKEGKNRIVVG